jgi:ATP-binding cassette subfamily B protein
MADIERPKMNDRGNGPLLWMWESSRGHWINVLVLAVVNIAVALCAVYEALALRNIINSAVAGDKNGLLSAAEIMAALTASRMIFPILSRWLSELTKAELENKLKDRLFKALLTKDYASVTAVHSGEWMNRMTSDTVLLANNAVDIIPNALATFIRLVVSVCLVIYLIKDVSWAVFPCAALLVAVTVILRGHMKKLHLRIQEADGRVRTFITDCLSGLMVIRSFSQEENSARRAEERMEDHKDRRMDRMRFNNIVSTGYQFILDGVYAAAVIYCGYSILTGNMSYGTFSAVITLIGSIQGPITNMSGYIPRWYALQASAERLMEAESFKEDYSNGKRSREDVLEFYRDRFEGLSLRDIGFTYRQISEQAEGNDRNVVISGLNIDVDKNDVYAVTGPSGCGKSTLLKILMSFYPLDSGERVIRVRGMENDKTESTIPLDSSWRGLFAYVPQGNHLMSGSIRDVLTFGERSFSEEEIRSALDIACASGFINELPEGIETMLGEHGAGLSEGQIQRLAIARAIISGQPVLLLDEATSSLDEATEADLITNLRKLTDRTVIIVTHRMKVLSICNKVLSMGDLDIKDEGDSVVSVTMMG